MPEKPIQPIPSFIFFQPIILEKMKHINSTMCGSLFRWSQVVIWPVTRISATVYWNKNKIKKWIKFLILKYRCNLVLFPGCEFSDPSCIVTWNLVHLQQGTIAYKCVWVSLFRSVTADEMIPCDDLKSVCDGNIGNELFKPWYSHHLYLYTLPSNITSV